MSEGARPRIPVSALVGLTVAVLGLAIALIATMAMLQRVRHLGMQDIGTIDELHREVAALKDSMERTESRGRSDARLLAKLRDGLGSEEIEDLKNRGLADPVSDIKADLMRHPELIPIPDVSGGRMGFYSADGIRILDEHWVYAECDDGHIAGAVLLAYDVKDGHIRWGRIAAREL